MKILYAIATLALLSTSAQAWQIVERCNHSKFFWQGVHDDLSGRSGAQPGAGTGRRKGEARQHREVGSVLQANAHL